MKTEDEARIAGKVLKARMKRGRWRICVWENMGWYYCLMAGENETGTVAIHPTLDGKYHALVGTGGTGFAIWGRINSYQDPNRAVIAAINRARRVVGEYLQIVEEAGKAAGR